MKFNFSTVFTALSACLLISLSSCKKDDLPANQNIFNPELKDLQIKSGFTENGILIQAKEWSVEYVKDGVSGELLQDKSGKAMKLDGPGSVEQIAGWMTLAKKHDDNFLTISLRENLDLKPRRILIGILADGKRDEISFTQSRGEAYAIIKKEIEEIAGSRKEYTSDEGIPEIILSNNTSEARHMETSIIFKDVYHVSEFISDDYGAFSWNKNPDSLIHMDELIIEDASYWNGKVPYKEGQVLQSFVKEGGSKEELLVQPFSNVRVRGEMGYLERECRYTFTIENVSSGNRFNISGTWKQKIALHPITHLYD